MAYFSGDFQMSETRRIVRQLPALVYSSTSPALLLFSAVPDHVIVLLFQFAYFCLTANITLQESHIVPCQSAVPYSKKYHSTSQFFSLST